MKISNNFHTRIVDEPKRNGKTFKPLHKHTLVLKGIDYLRWVLFFIIEPRSLKLGMRM